jgi:hypothetical protein
LPAGAAGTFGRYLRTVRGDTCRPSFSNIPRAIRSLLRLWIGNYEAGDFTDELAEAAHIAGYKRKIAELKLSVW